jgi:hypothetical protein
MKPRRLLNVLLITGGTIRTSGENSAGLRNVDLNRWHLSFDLEKIE